MTNLVQILHLTTKGIFIFLFPWLWRTPSSISALFLLQNFEGPVAFDLLLAMPSHCHPQLLAALDTPPLSILRKGSIFYFKGISNFSLVGHSKSTFHRTQCENLPFLDLGTLQSPASKEAAQLLHWNEMLLSLLFQCVLISTSNFHSWNGGSKNVAFVHIIELTCL